MHWAGIIAGSLIIFGSVFFFRDNLQMMLFLIGLAVGVMALPFVANIALESREEDKMNQMFLEFARNLAESVATGTPISKSIVNIKKKNYGVLNPYIEKLANQIEMGIPISTALETFGKDAGSLVIKRAIALIREAERAGGEIDYILESTASSIAEIDKLKKERKSAMYNLVIQGYIIFFIFIGIVLIMEFKLLPLTASVGSFGGLGGFGSDMSSLQNPAASVGKGIDTEQFTQPFLFLLLAQGFFAGLIIGKLTEGSVKSGIKHSFILMITAYLISTGSNLFLKGVG